MHLRLRFILLLPCQIRQRCIIHSRVLPWPFLHLTSGNFASSTELSVWIWYGISRKLHLWSQLQLFFCAGMTWLAGSETTKVNNSSRSALLHAAPDRAITLFRRTCRTLCICVGVSKCREGDFRFQSQSSPRNTSSTCNAMQITWPISSA